MAFDPNVPAQGAPNSSPQMRAQFKGLKALIDAAALGSAIAGRAQSPSALGPFAGTFSGPPTQSELQALTAYLETMRLALLRG